MHVRVRMFEKPEAIVVVDSKLTKIEKFRRILQEKFDVPPDMQRLLYGGKMLENGYTFHDYNIKLNDVIQLMVRVEPKVKTKDVKLEPTSNNDLKKEDTKIEYKDAVSKLYGVGDLVDVRDRELGSWFEATIVRIVLEPDVPSDCNINNSTDTKTESEEDIQNLENDTKNNSPKVKKEEISKSKTGIDKYFSTTPKSSTKLSEKQQPKTELVQDTDVNILYKVELHGEKEDDLYCNLKEIRPRARNVIDIKDLKVGQKVMINHNIDNHSEKGYWYDFEVSEIKKLRTCYEMTGTIYLGPESVPQNDTKVLVHDKIYAIENNIPLANRTKEDKKMMVTEPEKRAQPLHCLTCRDDEDAECKDCGCFLCSGKESPDKIILCDDCNKGYHMSCLNPPLSKLPKEDWYCPSCKRDPNEVVAPGAAKQTKKSTKSKRDWGRGMACASKTKTSAMPANHFGPIPGIEVGMCWRFRIQLSESGIHRPPVSGIHGRDVEGAYSIVLSGGYEDDVDNGNEFTYTGSGGRDLSGNKRTAEQSCDQTLTRENKALARNCAVKSISEEGGDAGDNWRNGRPVRVVRSYKMLKHFPKYAPKEGIRYDGIYKVVKYYPEKGLSGYRVWKYLLRRDDPTPAPWEADAKQFPIVYPDGYLEAEAEKKAQKEKKSKSPKANKKVNKKRAHQDSDKSSSSEKEMVPPAKKLKGNDEKPKRRGRPSKKAPSPSSTNTTNNGIATIFTNSKPEDKIPLSITELEAIHSDTINAKLWADCLEIHEKRGRKDFVDYVTEGFLCIICQDVAAKPVTTPCLHNFCLVCINQAYRLGDFQYCPYCRTNLVDYQPEINQPLMKALQIILAGYDAGRK